MNIIIYYSDSIEKVLFIINNNLELIEKCYKEERKTIFISEIKNDKIKDLFIKGDLNKILIYIEKIVNYQLNTKNIFIKFDESFWNNMIFIYNDFTNLVLIIKSILISKKINSNLNVKEITCKIHNCTNLGGLKNENLIQFIENEYSLLKDFDFDLPQIVSIGIDLENINDIFLEEWNKSKFFKYKFQKELIYKINNKNYKLFFKLFDYKDPKFFDKDISLLLCRRFPKLFPPNIKSEPKKGLFLKHPKKDNPPIINSSYLNKDVTFFIYIFDQKYDETKHFMENIIEKNFNSETLSEIYIDLVSNYNDISKDAKICIFNYLIKYINYLDEKRILVIFQKFNLDNLIIREQDLFTQENKLLKTITVKNNYFNTDETKIDSFMFLNIILNKQLNIKYPELYETNYFKYIIELGNKIKEGKIKFNLIHSILALNKDMIIKRLNIIFLNDKNNVENIKKLENRFNKIIEILEYIKILLNVLQNFFKIQYQNEIKSLINLEKEIEDGMLNDIEKIEMKKKINEIIIDLNNKIFNKIKTGEIKFNLIHSIWTTNKDMIIKRLNIIFSNDKNNAEIYIKELDNRYNKILEIFEYIKVLLIVIQHFFEVKHQNEIKSLINLGKEIKDGMLSDIEKKEMKERIDEIYKIIPNLNKKYLLKDSKFFHIFLDIKRANNPSKDEDELFNEAEEDYKKLKNLFNNNWINIIDQTVIKECFKALHLMNDNQMLNELQILRNYFELKDIDNSFLENLCKEIKIIKDKDQIFSVKENNNNYNSDLNQEILNLKNELNYKNQIIEQQNKTIINLQNQLNDLNVLNNNNQSIIQNLQNNINNKEQELKSLKYKFNNINEELSQLKLKYNNTVNQNENEITFAINFMSVDQDILYTITCKTIDTIVKLEEQLYNEFPKYKDYNTYLTVNGNLIKRFKTVEENEIKKGNAIIVNVYEE